MPKANVTILLSVRNSEKTLGRTLASVFKQTLKPAVVCVNDASTDGTADILARWKKKVGSRLTVIVNEKNLGLTKSLNKGLRRIRASYTARIDADDWWKADKLGKQVTFLENHPRYGVVGCNYVNIGPRGEKKMVMLETDQEIRRTIIAKNPFAHSCVVFRTRLVAKAGGYDESVRYGQDYELWLRLLPRTKFYNLQEFLCFRTTGSGISVAKQRQQMLQVLKTQARYIKKYRLPVTSYFAMVEPLVLVALPGFLTSLKRRVMG